MRAGTEVGEVANVGDDAGERGGEGEIGGGSDVVFAVQGVAVERGSEGRGDVGCGAGEGDAVVAGRDAVDGEALGLQPGRGLGDVGVGEAEAGAELGGREPLVVLGRGGILLGGDEGVEISLLLGAAAEVHGDGLERRGVVDGAEVAGDAGAGRLRAGERGTGGVGDGRGETGLRLLGRGRNRGKKESGEESWG